MNKDLHSKYPACTKFQLWFIGIIGVLMMLVAFSPAYGADLKSTEVTPTAVQVTDKLVDGADKFYDKVSEQVATIGNKLGDLAGQYGPDVWKMTEGVIRVNAINEIIIGLGFLAVTITLVKVAYKFWDKFVKCEYQDPWIIGTVIAGLITPFTGATTFNYLADVWTWIALFEPKLWLAHKVLLSVIK